MLSFYLDVQLQQRKHELDSSDQIPCREEKEESMLCVCVSLWFNVVLPVWDLSQRLKDGVAALSVPSVLKAKEFQVVP